MVLAKEVKELASEVLLPKEMELLELAKVDLGMDSAVLFSWESREQELVPEETVSATEVLDPKAGKETALEVPELALEVSL